MCTEPNFQVHVTMIIFVEYYILFVGDSSVNTSMGRGSPCLPTETCSEYTHRDRGPDCVCVCVCICDTRQGWPSQSESNMEIVCVSCSKQSEWESRAVTPFIPQSVFFPLTKQCRFIYLRHSQLHNGER